MVLNYLYKKFLETPTQKRDRKEEELHKQHFILHEMQFRPVLQDLARFFDLREQVHSLLKKQNRLVKFHYTCTKHYSHINLWIDPEMLPEHDANVPRADDCSTYFSDDSLI